MSEIDPIAFVERVGWLREQNRMVDQDCVRLVADARGTLIDAADLKLRYVALERLVDSRRDEVAIWRAYLYPPRSIPGRVLYAMAAGLMRIARRVG